MNFRFLDLSRQRSRFSAGMALVAIALFLLPACSLLDPCGRDKDQFLEKFEAFMDEVDDHRLPLGDPGWEERDERFAELVEGCYDQHAADMSGGEKRRFWFKAMGYYKDRFGQAALDRWLKGKDRE
jgi:hypothetical protein